MSASAQQAAWFCESIGKVRTELQKVLVGQSEIVEGILVALASNGHVLLEGMPGLGKTLLVRTLGEALQLDFSRIQFTPDMMPADVTGTNILSQGPDGSRQFEFRRGPIFSRLVLADEINRATPKTQSAMLEAMQERAVTAGGARHALDEPFLVMATQNPIEQEGTYPLPEAQLDRFFFKLLVPFPTQADLAEIVRRTTGLLEATVSPVASGQDILAMRQLVREVPIGEDVLQFCLAIVVGTHPEGEGATEASRKSCRYGSSPRGAQSLVTAAKCMALMDGRFNASREDVIRAAKPALRHRILLSYEAEADGTTADAVIDGIIREIQSRAKDPLAV